MNYALLAGMTILAVLATPASAQNSLEVGPIPIQMLGPERTSTLTVRNSADPPTNIHIPTPKWRQPDGQALYTTPPFPIANPPSPHLSPGAARGCRVGV